MARLPSAYCEVEWIQSDGECCLNSNFMPNGQTSVYGRLMFPTGGTDQNRWIWGCGANWNRNVFEFSTDVSTYHGFAWDYGANTGGGRLGSKPQAEHIYSVEQVKNTLKIIDETAGTTSHNTSYFSEQTFNTNMNMLIFSSSRGSDSPTSPKSIMRLWYLKIYDNGTLVRDMIPCYRKSDNEIGMYDIVNNVFYTNQGTGTFSKGNDIYTFPDFRAVKNFYIGKPGLPVEYQSVTFIESTGTQWIDTGYIPNKNTVVRTKFLNKATTGDLIFGYYTGDDTKDWRFFNYGSANFFDVPGGEDTGARITGGVCPSGVIYEYELGNFYIKNLATGEVIVSGTEQTDSGVSTITLNNYNNTMFSSNRFYYFNIYENNQLIHNFVPCYRKSDGEIGMYDIETGVFCTNQGTGTFLKGLDVAKIPKEYQQVEYIESDGTQWIDTGVVPTQNTVIQCCLANRSPTGNVILGYYLNSDSTDYRFFNFQGTCYFDMPNSARITNGRIETNNLYELELGNFYVKNLVTGTNIASGTTQGSFTGVGTITLNHYDTGNLNSNNKWYYVKIFNGDTPVSNLIPCYRKSDNEVGMYDTVSGTFKSNSGTGTFSKGNDIYPVVNSVEVIKISIPSGEITHNLPTEYQEVEYIESDGTQWVDSGTASQVGHKHTFEGTISITSNNGDRETVWGNDYTDLQQNTLLQYAELGEKATWTYYHSLIDDSTLLKKNGITVSSGSYSYGGNATIAIFSSYFYYPMRYSHIKLFELKIYYDDETTPIRHFIPCYRKSDGIIGLYDIINGAFHTKQSGNDFTKGDDIIGEIVLWEKPEQ